MKRCFEFVFTLFIFLSIFINCVVRLPFQSFSPYSNNPSVDEKSSEIMQWAQQTGPTVPATPPLHNPQPSVEPCGIKRPVLASMNYEEFKDEDLGSGLLYDYTLLNAWLVSPSQHLFFFCRRFNVPFLKLRITWFQGPPSCEEVQTGEPQGSFQFPQVRPEDDGERPDGGRCKF